MKQKAVPTIQDVAREAGVSPSTVSNVLNRRWRQTSKETRERILEVARKLNYHPNAMAAALRRRSTRTIGVIVTSILNPFYTAVVRGIQDEARRHGYTTILGNTDDDPEQEREMLNALRAKQGTPPEDGVQPKASAAKPNERKVGKGHKAVTAKAQAELDEHGDPIPF